MMSTSQLSDFTAVLHGFWITVISSLAITLSVHIFSAHKQLKYNV